MFMVGNIVFVSYIVQSFKFCLEMTFTTSTLKTTTTEEPTTKTSKTQTEIPEASESSTTAEATTKEKVMKDKVLKYMFAPRSKQKKNANKNYNVKFI